MEGASGARIASGADQRFWDALAGGRLEMQRCARCSTWHWPAVWRCAACGSWEQAWIATPMRGTVYAWTRTWHPFGGLEAISKPFVTVVVELSEAGGRRLAGLLDGDEGALRTGAAVTGRAATTTVAGEAIPSIHWRLNQEAAR